MRVTEQIITAERLDDGDADMRVSAWLDVSHTEEAIATHPATSGVELDIAQRGAITAAVRSGDLARAESLRQKFGLQEE